LFVSFTWTAGPGDDARDLVVALAEQIDAMAGVVASSEDTVLAIARITGGAISASLAVTAAGTTD